jgi:hypothetical protein
MLQFTLITSHISLRGCPQGFQPSLTSHGFLGFPLWKLRWLRNTCILYAYKTSIIWMMLQFALSSSCCWPHFHHVCSGLWVSTWLNQHGQLYRQSYVSGLSQPVLSSQTKLFKCVDTFTHWACDRLGFCWVLDALNASFPFPRKYLVSFWQILSVLGVGENWGLNSGLLVCKAGTLPLDLYSSPWFLFKGANLLNDHRIPVHNFQHAHFLAKTASFSNV